MKLVRQIESLGTRVVSFVYKGKVRNVIVGANLPNGGPDWGRPLSRSLVAHKGNIYLIPRVRNDTEANYKAFDLEKIENFSFKA